MKLFIKIGRDNTNDVIINEPRVGRSHAIITDLGNGMYEVKDLTSENGTFVNGHRITKQLISPGDIVQVATSLVDWVAAFQANPKMKEDAAVTEKEFSKLKKSITIGTSLENDLVINENYVSKHHAKISVLKNGDYYIQDLGSSNGSFVNGIRVLAKNFSKTDMVKIAKSDLPENWFKHKKLQPHFFKDNKKKLLVMITALLLLSTSAIYYFNRCNWFGIGCNLNYKQMYVANKDALVHIYHDYYYSITYNGIKYYVGKNKNFVQQTEANTDKQQILPYSKVTGNGCFVNADGTILTSPLIVNPWFNDIEKYRMIQEVIDSKTIKGLTKTSKINICGESGDLKWIQNGVVNNQQNYIQATSRNECSQTDSSTAIIQSIKKSLPPEAKVARYNFKEKAFEKMNNTEEKYYSYLVLPVNNEIIKDTFYMARDTVNINSISVNNLPEGLPQLNEGSAVFNYRGELIGIIMQKQIVMLNLFFKQITK